MRRLQVPRIAFGVSLIYTDGMSIVWYIGIVATLMIVAALASLIGIGGGVLYTPLQILYGIEIHSAATNSLFLIIVLSLSATVTYRRAGRIDWHLAFMLEVFTVAGGAAGGYLSDFIPPRPLTALLIAALIYAGFVMLRRDERNHSRLEKRRAWYRWNRHAGGQRYTVNMLIACPVSLAAGCISGLVGIGGGVIKVPMLVILFGIPIDIAIATSVFMVGITAAGGFAGHLAAGHWQWKISLLFAPAIIIGAQIGSHIMLRTRKDYLKKIFATVLLLIAAVVLVRLIL